MTRHPTEDLKIVLNLLGSGLQILGITGISPSNVVFGDQIAFEDR